MAGRPRGATNLVDNIINEEQLINEDQWLMYNLSVAIGENISCIKWLASRKLLKNNYRCEKCNQLCILTKYSQGTDGYRWQCNPCHFSKSIRTGSFFSRSHTQNIECLWGKLKRFMRHGSRRSSLLDSYLAEFMWRESIVKDPFPACLVEIIHRYPL
jgi:hypothetical protein